jgi:indole-3-glycerol phosphate synthase
MTFLHEVALRKRQEAKDIMPRQTRVKQPNASLVKAIDRDGFALIAEIKRASPSEGMFRQVDAVKTARIYEAAGASAISVLTDKKDFGGSIDDLIAVKGAVGIPVLRKDFIIDERQLRESAECGADAVLLIADLLGADTRCFVEMAHGLGLECLVEVHSPNDLTFALHSPARLIGINNRDLHSLRIDLKSTELLAPRISNDRLIVSESGINTRDDVLRMRAAGASAVLVGSCLMKSDDISAKIKELLGR